MRTGTRADVELQSEFMKEVKAAAGAALKSTPIGVGVDPRDMANPWAVFGTISTGLSSNA